MLYQLVKNEVFKLFVSKKIYVIMIVMLFFTVLPKFEELIGSIDIPIYGQNLPIYMLGTHVFVIIPLYIIVSVAQMMTDEYVSGTLKTTLLHPVSRTRLFLAKWIGLGVTVLGLLLFAMAIAFLFGTLFFGWGDTFFYDDLYFSTAEGLMITFASYLITLVPFMVFSLVIMLLSLFFTSGGVVSVISVGLLVLMNISGELFKMLQPYLLVGSFRGFANDLFVYHDLSAVTTHLIVMAVYGLLSYVAAVNIFKRKDLAY